MDPREIQNYSTKGDYVPKNLREFYDIVKHNLNKEGVKIPIEKQWISMRFQLLDENTLKIRGYIGFSVFGRTAIWKRATKQ